MGSLSEGQLSAALSHGGQLISADQRITDERNAYALQVQARAAFASAAASAPPGGTLSADDIEFASRILSQPATAGAAGAGGYVSNTFTPLGLQDRALSTDVRGGFDAYGNSTANTSEFDLGSVLKQGSIGFLKGTINSVPSTLMGLANGITQGAVIQGELEAGVDVRTALADGRQATAGWWNGQVFSYDNSVQRGFGFLGELVGPVGELKALSLVRDGIVAADFGATLDRMAYSFGTRTGTILSITEAAPTAVGEAIAGGKIPVQFGDVMTYGESKAGAVIGDGLTGDHIPSFAAVRENVEATLDRPLTRAEESALRDNTNTIVIVQDLHAAGRTYFGANTPAQIAQDATDLGAAALRDQTVHPQNAPSLGYSPSSLQVSFDRLSLEMA